jgi:hypothetical protein
MGSMRRFFSSLLLGLLLGGLIGLYFGWVQFPVEYVDSPMQDLELRAKDDYTVMIAASYQYDKDGLGAVERLYLLGVDNVPEYVQNVTERFITNSSNVNDIRLLVNLSEGLGRLTPIMEPFLDLTGGDS